MRATLPDCCARAASGHAVTPLPRSAMNSRRLMGFSQTTDQNKYSRSPVACVAIKSGDPCPRWVIRVDFNVGREPAYPQIPDILGARFIRIFRASPKIDPLRPRE